MKTITEIKQHFSDNEIKLCVDIIKGKLDFSVLEEQIKVLQYNHDELEKRYNQIKENYKMGYVDENSVLHEMSDKYKSWKDEYVEYLNTDSKYNEISSGTITDTSNTSAIDQVKDLCSANSECAGFTLNTSNNSYSLKNENIYPIGNK